MSHQSSFTSSVLDDDDDFENPAPILSLTQKTTSQSARKSSFTSNSSSKWKSTKKPKLSSNPFFGKENQSALSPPHYHNQIVDPTPVDPSLGDLSLVPSSLDCTFNVCNTIDEVTELDENKEKKLAFDKGYLSNSIESRLINSRTEEFEEFEPGTQLNILLRLCSEEEEKSNDDAREDRAVIAGDLVYCPLCGTDISDLNEESRHLHTNNCLDKMEPSSVVGTEKENVEPVVGCASFPNIEVVDVSPVLHWLRRLDLAKFEDVFVREEIDWDTLLWLTEEDLFNIGIAALGPRKKILHALNELRQGSTHAKGMREKMHVTSDPRTQSFRGTHEDANASIVQVDKSNKLIANKLITDYFPAPLGDMNKSLPTSGQRMPNRKSSDSSNKRVVTKVPARNRKLREVPTWCTIPGTTFRVDAFQYLSRDCSHWFLTHFHLDHYQGLTKSFSHGKIYCSLITAKLVNMKIGIAWDRLQILPLNEKMNIAGTGVTCLDANHCPGSIIILFEPPNDKAILHTGDFRFSDKMKSMPTCRIHTLILDTTYCDPQYDFPKQDAVIQFVIEAIQAETFNEKTLFLIGSYTIGKERLYLEVARALRKKVYVNATKLLILKCLGFSDEDMTWFTSNEEESHIHVVPMWMLASFKRLKHISNHYANRFNLIVAFSPTGWTFGKGKKKTPGRRWQQGTLIRYEVPYSEHSSFTELKEFVKFISPLNILPSVNNNGSESVDAMTSLLLA